MKQKDYYFAKAFPVVSDCTYKFYLLSPGLLLRAYFMWWQAGYTGPNIVQNALTALLTALNRLPLAAICRCDVGLYASELIAN